MPEYLSSIGGLQVCVHNICKLHAQGGSEVTVLTSDSSAEIIQTPYAIRKIPALKFLTKGYPISKYLVSCYFGRIQEKCRFDLYQIDGGFPYGVLLVDFFNKNGIPSILRCSGDDIQINEEYDYGVRRNNKIDKLIREKYHKFDAAVAITETVKEEYLSIGIPKKKIRIIPNGIDYNRIRNFKVKRNIKEFHKIPANAQVILTVGRNHPKKGYAFIPKILNNLLKERKDIYWIVIGKGSRSMNGTDALGSKRGHLILINELALNNYDDEVPSDLLINYYRQADVFAMTSLLETFGVVLLEAMASGLPIVYFNVPGVRDVMSPECGMAHQAGNCSAFSGSLLEILDDERKLSYFRMNCFQHAERFSWEKVAADYLSLYQEVTSLIP